MKKKIIMSVIAVVLVAGIGTGVYFGVRAKNKASQTNTSETTTLSENETTAGEKTTESVKVNAESQKTEATTAPKAANSTIKAESNSSITFDEFNKKYPLCTNPVESFEKGKYYVPTSGKVRYGERPLLWGADGKSVLVSENSDKRIYTLYKLNDYGEIIEMGYYTLSQNNDAFDYEKRLSGDTYRYDENHRIVSIGASDKASFKYDRNGNMTDYNVDQNPNEKLYYDSNGNIIKCYIPSFRDQTEKMVTFRYKMNSFGLPVCVWSSVNGGAEDSGRNIEYTNASKAQYDFYMNYLRVKLCLNENYDF